MKGFLPKQDSEKLVHAFVFSILDYCTVTQLQLIQSTVARVLTNAQRVEHTTSVLTTVLVTKTESKTN